MAHLSAYNKQPSNFVHRPLESLFLWGHCTISSVQITQGILCTMSFMRTASNTQQMLLVVVHCFILAFQIIYYNLEATKHLICALEAFYKLS